MIVVPAQRRGWGGGNAGVWGPERLTGCASHHQGLCEARSHALDTQQISSSGYHSNMLFSSNGTATRSLWRTAAGLGTTSLLGHHTNLMRHCPCVQLLTRPH